MTKCSYVLRTCNEDMTSEGGFKWPMHGPVACDDWDPAPHCGGGLHGFLNGVGDGLLADWDPLARWLVVRVETDKIVDLGGQVKFPEGYVVHCGDRESALGFLENIVGDQFPMIGAVRISGIYGQSTSGHKGQSTSGFYGQSTSGYYGQSLSGYKGQSTSGYKGESTSGYLGESFTRNGRVRAGKGGVLYISWVENSQREFLACKVGEMGTKPYTWYELSPCKTKFVESTN